MRPDEIKEAVFGSFDGLTSNLGVIAGLIAAGAVVGIHIFAAALGLSIAATFGMGVGQYLSNEQGQRSVRLALVMAAATFIGSIIPALPLRSSPVQLSHCWLQLGSVATVAIG